MAGESQGQARFKRGEHVQLREIPGLVGRVLADLYACTPPMTQVDFNTPMGMPAVIETARLERVVFDVQTQDWRAARAHERSGGNGA